MLTLCLGAVPAHAERPWWREKTEYTPSYNDYGATGLLQIPNARMQPDGQINVGFSNVQPYRRYVINLQALPWLEAGFRFTQILNRIEPSSVLFGDEQNFFDRGVDLKIRLSPEMRFLPEIAVGVRDLGGTNLFGSEYLAFSRRWNNFDFTGGIAWGNLGSRGHLPNPFTILGDAAKDREGDNRAGSFNPRFFRGEKIGLFGGVEYVTPIDGLRLKLEYDSNSYQQEPLNNPLETRTPINAGIEYRPLPWIHLTAGIERGNNLLARATLSQSLTKKAEIPKFLDPPPEPVSLKRPQPRPVLPVAAPEWRRPCALVEQTASRLQVVRIRGRAYTVHLSTLCRPAARWLSRNLRAALKSHEPNVETVALVALADGMAAGPAYLPYNQETIPVEAIFQGFDDEYHQRIQQSERLEKRAAARVLKALRKDGFPASGVRFNGQEILVWMEQRTFRNQVKGLGRAARIIANRAPGDVEFIRLQVMRRELAIADISLRRKDVENGGATASLAKSPDEAWHLATLAPPGRRQDIPRPEYFPEGQQYPRANFSITPAFRQNIGGPDQYYVFQIYAAANADVQLARGWSVGGSYGIDLYNNFDAIQLESNSQLPRVRTDLKQYLQQGSSGLFSLDTHYLFNIRPEWYGKISAGLFEPMFGGGGGEVLYAPFEKRWAVGGEFYWVKKRNYDLDLKFLDYETTTGHLSLYYKFPAYELVGRLHAGRYLAGDDGATFELSREFDSGVTAGVFATLTDVPFDKFGEGSFDKGFYISVPLDMFLAKSSQSRRGLAFRPVTRDGGARLDVGNRLYGIVDNATKPTLEKNWRNIFD